MNKEPFSAEKEEAWKSLLSELEKGEEKEENAVSIEYVAKRFGVTL